MDVSGWAGLGLQSPFGLSGGSPAKGTPSGSFSGPISALGPAAAFDPLTAIDPIATLAPGPGRRGSSNSQALVSLGYGGAADPGGDTGNVQAMVATLGGSAFRASEGFTSPSKGAGGRSTEAQQGLASLQQFLATSGLDLLA